MDIPPKLGVEILTSLMHIVHLNNIQTGTIYQDDENTDLGEYFL